jgi:hypothetical protein
METLLLQEKSSPLLRGKSNIPPAEAEARYYAQAEAQSLAA